MTKAEGASERRHSERAYCHGRAMITRLNDAAVSMKVQVMNLSDGGIRIVAAEPFEKGWTYSLILNKEDQVCRVCECKPLFEGFAIRSEFV